MFVFRKEEQKYKSCNLGRIGSKYRVSFSIFLKKLLWGFSVVIQVDQKFKTLFKVENPFQTDGPLKQVETDQVRDGTLVRMTMPGVGPDGMKVWVVDNTVFYSGEGEIELPGEDSGRSYGGSIEFDPKFNRAAGVKADIANGVLRLLVPYAKGGEKKKDGYERVVNL